MELENLLKHWGININELNESSIVPQIVYDESPGLSKSDLHALAVALPRNCLLHSEIMGCLLQKADNFSDWRILYEFEDDDESRRHALKQLTSLANGFSELLCLYQILLPKDEQRSRIYQRLCMVMASVHEWLRAYKLSCNSDKLHFFAAQQVQKLCFSLDDAISIYNQLNSADPLREELRKKIKQLA